MNINKHMAFLENTNGRKLQVFPILASQARRFTMLPAECYWDIFENETVVFLAEREGVIEDRYGLSLCSVASSLEA